MQAGLNLARDLGGFFHPGSARDPCGLIGINLEQITHSILPAIFDGPMQASAGLHQSCMSYRTSVRFVIFSIRKYVFLLNSIF